MDTAWVTSRNTIEVELETVIDSPKKKEIRENCLNSKPSQYMIKMVKLWFHYTVVPHTFVIATMISKKYYFLNHVTVNSLNPTSCGQRLLKESVISTKLRKTSYMNIWTIGMTLNALIHRLSLKNIVVYNYAIIRLKVYMVSMWNICSLILKDYLWSENFNTSISSQFSPDDSFLLWASQMQVNREEQI